MAFPWISTSHMIQSQRLGDKALHKRAFAAGKPIGDDWKYFFSSVVRDYNIEEDMLICISNEKPPHTEFYTLGGRYKMRIIVF